MVTLRILSNTRAEAIGLTDAQAKALDDELAFQKSRFWWKSKAAKQGRWDGFTRMFHRDSGTFPLGLIVTIKKWLKRQKLRFNVEDTRPPANVLPNGADYATLGGGITLYPYQVAAVEKVLARERGVIHGATGCGKTEIAAAVIKAYGTPVTLFVTGRKKLARQTRERFAKRLGLSVEDIGFIHNGQWHHGSSGIYIAVIQTLTQKKWAKERSKLYRSVDLLFIDEAHHAGSTTWYQTLMFCRARYRYGLSATPVGRSDSGDLYLKACTGGVIARVKAADLIEKGVLAKPTIYFTEVRRPKLVETGVEWADIYRKGIVENKWRNRVIVDYAEQLQALDLPTLVLVQQIAHGYALEEQIDGSVFLHGDCEDDFIDQTCEAFERGEVKTLIATSIFDEGVDIPTIRAMIAGSGGKSVIKTLQRIGRGLRKKAQDNRLFVFDFVDATSEYLLDHSERRQETCRREHYEVKTIRGAGHLAKLVA